MTLPVPGVLATQILAAFTWDPGFRGILTVGVAVLVLCGSVYLLLATNAGTRLGFLLALTGLMGWMTILGVVWSVYGLGYQGQAPAWTVKEVNNGELTEASTEQARVVPEPSQLPDPLEVRDSNPDLAQQFPQGPGLKVPNLGDLVGVDPQLEDQINSDLPGGWELLPTSDPLSGEATAAAEAYLTESGRFAEATDFEVIESFDKGGKEAKPDDAGLLGSAWYKIKSIAKWPLGHPTHYAVVQVQQVIPQEAAPGQPPPLPETDPDKPVVSVIMTRDLGTLRLPSVGFTIFSGIIFVVCCVSLHRRDKLVAKARALAAET